MLVYPVTDLVVAGLATLLVLRSVGRPPRDLLLIALAFVTWATADNGYALLTVRGTDTTVTTVALAYVVAALGAAVLCIALGWGRASSASTAAEPSRSSTPLRHRCSAGRRRTF